MIKHNNPAYVGYIEVVFTFIIVLCCICTSAYSQEQNYTLLVQQTPDEAGEVTPDSGIHKFAEDSEVTLTATPKPGFEFLYWLGDVSNQDSSSTVVRLDKPKIVIAVFKPVQDELKTGTSPVSGSGGGGAALYHNPVTISSPGAISGTGAKSSDSQKVYVPSGDTPPVIPEPATGLLLTLGSVLTFTKRKRKISPSQN